MKKILRVMAALVLALALAFAFAACSGGGEQGGTEQNQPEQNLPEQGGEEEQPGGNEPGQGEEEQPEQGGTEEDDVATAMAEAIEKLASERYLTFTVDGHTANNSLRRNGETYFSASDMRAEMSFVRNQDYVYDLSYSAHEEYENSNSEFNRTNDIAIIYKDGLAYMRVDGYTPDKNDGPLYVVGEDGQVEYTYRNEEGYISGMVSADVRSPVILMSMANDLSPLVSSYLKVLDLLAMRGYNAGISAEDGGKVITLEADLEECRQSIIELLNKLADTPADELKSLANTLFDGGITLDEFIDTANGALAEYGFSIEVLANDAVMFAVLGGSMQSDYFDDVFMGDWLDSHTMAVYNFLREFGGSTVNSVLSEPREDETVFEYISRSFGGFKMTGLLELVSGEEEGYGEQTFANIRETLAGTESVLDFIDEVLYPNADHSESGLLPQLSSVTMDGSTFSVQIHIDGDGYITRMDYGMNMNTTYLDEDSFIISDRVVLNMSVDFSYAEVVVTAPSANQIIR